MLSALKKTLAFWTTSRPKESVEIQLFSGSAYFSARVPKVFSEKWAHGGTISSGTTWDVRARYLFAIDPSEPWVTKLFAKSVTVFHAGWIAHCVDQAFRVPIAEYILDDRFITEPPYKLTENFAPPIYIPLSEPSDLMDTDSGEAGPTLAQTSDTPSTPTSMPRKRRREQAYFDSPSGSLVFSGFDKDGMPRRPRKQRKLRFDPSFSPGCGRSNQEAMERASLDLYQDPHDHSGDDDGISKEYNQVASSLRGRLTTVRSSDTPDISRTNKETSLTHPSFSLDQHLSKSTLGSSPAISIDKTEKILPVRTIDFTNLPPRARRPGADRAKSGTAGMMLSGIKYIDLKVKTPKKISFADHARVCVYTVSPGRPGSKGDPSARSSERQCLGERCEDVPILDDKIWGSSDEVKGSDDSPTEVTARINDGSTRSAPNEDQSENDTLTLTTGDVEVMRRRLLESAVKNGADSGQLATLLELGKTYQGMVFHHVW